MKKNVTLLGTLIQPWAMDRETEAEVGQRPDQA